MKLKNSVIYGSIGALNKLSNVELPIKVAYVLKKNINELNKQIEFINNQRNDLIKKYGKDDKIEQTDTEAVQKFMNDFNEVLSIEEEVEIKVIDVEELGNVKLTVSDLDALSFMIN